MMTIVIISSIRSVHVALEPAGSTERRRPGPMVDIYACS